MRRWLMFWTLTCGLTGQLAATETAPVSERQRIQELEQRIRELEQELARPKPPAIAPRPAFPESTRPAGVPGDAVEREFNGAKYYLIPLKSRKTAAVRIPSA